MKRAPLTLFPRPGFLSAILILLVVSGCGMLPKSPTRDYERLEKIIKIYNNEFESRSDRAGAMWIKTEYRESYLIKVKEVQERINFLDSQILSVMFLNKGKAIKQSGSTPEEEFDEAIVRNRYEYVLSPSVSLVDKVVEQRWVREGGAWKLIPDLEAFFK
jgi:hypothetical protein